MKYIAKKNTWFDEGTEAVPISEFIEAYDDINMTKRNDFALFRGTRNGNPDEETCPLDEFEIINE